MKEKRNTTMLIIITIAVFLVAVIGATFAYFAAERNVGSSINANVWTAASMYSFSATSLDTIEMDIAFNEMSQASVSNVVLKSDNANITVSLSSPTDDTLTTCTYDIVWVWEDGDKYTTPDETLPFIEGGKEYKYEFSTTVDGANEKDLSNLEEDGKTVKLQEGLSITSDSTTATTKTHTIVANIYNLPVEQTNLFNKKFKAHVTIDNLKCSMESKEAPAGIPLATYIMNDVYNSRENQDNIKNKAAGVYYHNASLANGAADDTYRYAGADGDVNNYVCFEGACTENDLYRIISVDSNNQIKVIKATNLWYMAWNSAGTNTWEGSSLETYLNGTYLTSLGEKANKIETTTWSVGGASYNDLETKNVKAFMSVELNKSVTYSAKIGLMYISEYGFAALPEYWTNVMTYNDTNGYNLSKGKDWMLTSVDNNPWTISRSFDSLNAAFRVDADDGCVYSERVARGNGVRPSFVLSSDVKITNAGAEGVGTKDKPMVIS